MPKTVSTEDPILYPEVEIYQRRVGFPDGPITAEEMKEILGWTEEPDGEHWGMDYLFVDAHGKKVRLTKNSKNRPFNFVHAKKLGQTHLTREFRFNCETFIISNRGNVTSGQHRGVGLILAWQRWIGPPAESGLPNQSSYWQQIWETEPTMETLLVRGAPEDPEVLRTLDNTRPRGLSDVVYTSGKLSGEVSPREAERLARMIDHCVKKLWVRTGADADPFSPFATNANSMSFLDRHPRIVDAVTHIFELYGRGIGPNWKVCCTRIGPGYAAALLYLMGAMNADGDAYRNERPRTEEGVDFSRWEEAKEFWKLLVSNPSFHGLRTCLAEFADASGAGGTGRLREKEHLFLKAWHLFVAGKEMKEKSLKLKYRSIGGVEILDDFHDASGIDLGDPVVRAGDPKDHDVAPPPEEAAEIDAERAKIREAKRNKNRIVVETPAGVEVDEDEEPAPPPDRRSLAERMGWTPIQTKTKK